MICAENNSESAFSLILASFCLRCAYVVPALCLGPVGPVGPVVALCLRCAWSGGSVVPGSGGGWSFLFPSIRNKRDSPIYIYTIGCMVYLFIGIPLRNIRVL